MSTREELGKNLQELWFVSGPNNMGKMIDFVMAEVEVAKREARVELLTEMVTESEIKCSWTSPMDMCRHCHKKICPKDISNFVYKKLEFITTNSEKEAVQALKNTGMFYEFYGEKDGEQ